MVASNSDRGRLHVWIGDGQGQLVAAADVEVSYQPLGFVDVDVDANGTVDLLVADSNRMSVLLGDGMGGFVHTLSEDVTLVLGDGEGNFLQGATYPVGMRPSGIVTGDFNDDGVPDMAVSNQGSYYVGLILSDP